MPPRSDVSIGVGEPRNPSRVQRRMAHASNIIHCDGPECPHAFDIIPLQPRNGSLDARCPVCRGHGQWNVEIDLVSFRCKRAICARCQGAGWVETGRDPIGVPDIELTAAGYPRWVTTYAPPEQGEADRSEPGLIVPD